MSKALLESHITKIQNHIIRCEETAKYFSRISISRLQAISAPQGDKESFNSTPVTTKLLNNWRDSSITLENTTGELFTLKRKEPSQNAYSVQTNYKLPKSQHLDNEEIVESASSSEIIENSDDEDCHNCADWVTEGKVMWQNGIKNFDPDELFNPNTTPNGKGFICDIRQIFFNKRSPLKVVYEVEKEFN